MSLSSGPGGPPPKAPLGASGGPPPASLKALCALLALGLALGHAELKGASPAPGSRLKAPPKEVVLEFPEAFDPRLSSFAVYALGEVGDAKRAQGLAALLLAHPERGVRADLGARVEGLRVRLRLKPLKPGAYAVVYRVLALDTHATRGAYAFLYAP